MKPLKGDLHPSKLTTMSLRQKPGEPVTVTTTPVLRKLQSQRKSTTPRRLNNAAFVSNNDCTPHPLLQFLVMWNALNYLDLEDLKNSRLVCKLWNEVGTSFLPQRSEVRLYCARKTKNVKAESKSIIQFSKFLKKPSSLEQQSAFKLTNLAISRFGHDIRPCLCNNGGISGKNSPSSASCPFCVVFSRCRNTLKTLSFDSVPWTTFHLAMKTVFINFPSLESLKITYQDGTGPSSDESERAPDLNLPDDQPKLYGLKYFYLESSAYKHNDIGRVFDFKVFWKMAPNITDITLKDSYRTLAIILESLAPYGKQLPVSKLNIIALDPYVEVSQQERQKLVEGLRKVFTNLRLKELILEMNLNVLQWSLAIAGNLPPTIHRLCISSDFCMGPDYAENPNNKFNENDSADRVFGILGTAVPESLQELAFYFIGARGMDKNFQFQPATLKFDSVRDLSWIFVKKNSASWEPFFPNNGFQELATVFPNVRRLEATIGTKKALRQICTILPLLEELIISNYSRLKLSDSDILGEPDSLMVANSRKKQNKNVGLVALKKLRSLTIESDCTNLTDVSIYQGFLKMPELKELDISDGPEFGSEAMQALFDKNFAQLSIQHE